MRQSAWTQPRTGTPRGDQARNRNLSRAWRSGHGLRNDGRFFGHAVGESNDDLKALIGAANEFPGPGFMLPTRNSELLRWCLDKGLRIIQPIDAHDHRTLQRTRRRVFAVGDLLKRAEFGNFHSAGPMRHGSGYSLPLAWLGCHVREHPGRYNRDFVLVSGLEEIRRYLADYSTV